MAVIARRAILPTKRSSPRASGISLGVGAIVGIVIGSLCAVSILCLLFWFLRWRQRRTRRVTIIPLCCTASSDGEVENRRVSELIGWDCYGGGYSPIPQLNPDGTVAYFEGPLAEDRASVLSISTPRTSSDPSNNQNPWSSIFRKDTESLNVNLDPPGAQVPAPQRWGTTPTTVQQLASIQEKYGNQNGGSQATVKNARLDTGVSPWELEYHPNPVIFAHLADIQDETPSLSQKSMDAKINGVRFIGHEDIAARPGSMGAVAYSQDLAMNRSWNAPPNVEEWSQSIPSVPVSGYQRAPSLEWDVDLGPNPDFAQLFDRVDSPREEAAPQQLADCLGEVLNPMSEPQLPHERNAKRSLSNESMSARQSSLDDDEALAATTKRPRRWMDSHRTDDRLRQMSVVPSKSIMRNSGPPALSVERELGVSSSTVTDISSSTRETTDSEHESNITSPSSSLQDPNATPASSAPSDMDFSFSCPDCELKYRTPGQLRVHANRKHIRRFGCTVCGKDFNLGADLDRHMRTVHKAEGLDVVDGDGTSVLRCPNVGCRNADKVWDRKDNLARHIVRCRKATRSRTAGQGTL
jgi:hypothetical protein